MAAMTVEQGDAQRADWRSDWWLWPSAVLLALAGWSQALWMWDNSAPTGLTPLWLLGWIGLGVAGIALAIYWLARRWWPFAWLAVVAWAGVPKAIELAQQYDVTPDNGTEWVYDFSPLFVLLLLGVGFSGAMMSLAWYAGRRWSDWSPKTRALREALWSGLFVVIGGLLLISRAYSWASLILLAGGLILIETYLVLRESVPEPSEQEQSGIPEVGRQP
jgi:hypothetical protein